MPKQLTHEEIAQRFVEAKFIDYAALGKLIADFGPSLAVHDNGLHGVAFGRWNTLACMLPAFDVARVVGDLRGAGLAAHALEGVLEGGTAR